MRGMTKRIRKERQAEAARLQAEMERTALERGLMLKVEKGGYPAWTFLGPDGSEVLVYWPCNCGWSARWRGLTGAVANPREALEMAAELVALPRSSGLLSMADLGLVAAGGRTVYYQEGSRVRQAKG